MQKARRLACSTASVSSPANTTLKIRRRSRTSSAGGDYVDASKSNIPTDPFESKFRLRKRNKARVASKNRKKAKKTAKASKFVRPTFGSLQNTVVLAPFHTLKKCFQTKLVDLYFNEKIKKNNYKSKMAEKQNMLFEYDVMEFNNLEQKNAQKEKKGSKGKKGEARFKDKASKSRRNRSKSEKSQSYCQCEKTNTKTSREQKTISPKESSSRNQSKKPEKRGFSTSLGSNDYQRVFSISSPEDSKKRRVDGPQITTLSAGPEYGIAPDLLQRNRTSCSELRSETNLSFSNVSSRSKIDSWETISDSPSYRIFEGSLAISTTSFDSCLEQYERDSCNYSEQSGIRSRSSGTNSRYNTRLRALKEKSEHGNRVENFTVNLEDDESGQCTMSEKVNNSDGQLIDFMDREPQTQIIPSSEISQHLQPLRRKSKTQSRKSNRENDSSKAYFLRSHSASKERVKTVDSEEHNFLGNYRNSDELERRVRLATVSGVQKEGDNIGREEDNVESVDVSCKGNLALKSSLPKDKSSCQNQADLSQPLSELSSSNTDNTTDCSKITETTDEVKKSSSQKETNLNLALDNEPPCEILHKRRTDTATDEQNGSIINNSPEEDKINCGVEERTGEGPRLLGDFGGQPFVELLPARETMNRFQESSDVDRHVSHQPQDKEPSFIFGPRTTSDRLGESCEFSFGLNWVFSDDDNSDHGDHFL